MSGQDGFGADIKGLSDAGQAILNTSTVTGGAVNEPEALPMRGFGVFDAGIEATTANSDVFSALATLAGDLATSTMALGMFAELAGKNYVNQDTLTEAKLVDVFDGAPGRPDPLAPASWSANDAVVGYDRDGRFGFDIDKDGLVDIELTPPEPPKSDPAPGIDPDPRSRGQLDPWRSEADADEIAPPDPSIMDTIFPVDAWLPRPRG